MLIKHKIICIALKTCKSINKMEILFGKWQWRELYQLTVMLQRMTCLSPFFPIKWNVKSSKLEDAVLKNSCALGNMAWICFISDFRPFILADIFIISSRKKTDSARVQYCNLKFLNAPQTDHLSKHSYQLLIEELHQLRSCDSCQINSRFILGPRDVSLSHPFLTPLRSASYFLRMFERTSVA